MNDGGGRTGPLLLALHTVCCGGLLLLLASGGVSLATLLGWLPWIGAGALPLVLLPLLLGPLRRGRRGAPARAGLADPSTHGEERA